MHENRLQFLPDLVPVSGQWTVVCPGLTWVQNKCFCSFKRFEPSIIIIIIYFFSVLLKFSCWTVWLWLWLHTVFIRAYCRCVYQKSRCLSWIKSTQILSSESETRPDSLLEYLFVPFDLCVSVVTLRRRCDQFGASLPTHAGIQHRYHRHCTAGSAGQSWQQTGSCLTGRMTIKSLFICIIQIQNSGSLKKSDLKSACCFQSRSFSESRIFFPVLKITVHVPTTS